MCPVICWQAVVWWHYCAHVSGIILIEVHAVAEKKKVQAYHANSVVKIISDNSVVVHGMHLLIPTCLPGDSIRSAVALTPCVREHELHALLGLSEHFGCLR